MWVYDFFQNVVKVKNIFHKYEKIRIEKFSVLGKILGKHLANKDNILHTKKTRK